MLYLLVRAFPRGQQGSRRNSVAPADRPSRRTCWMVERRPDGRGHVQAADIDASRSDPSLAVSARMREQRQLGQWRAADRAIPERPVKRAAAMKIESPSTPPPLCADAGVGIGDVPGRRLFREGGSRARIRSRPAKGSMLSGHRNNRRSAPIGTSRKPRLVAIYAGLRCTRLIDIFSPGGKATAVPRVSRLRPRAGIVEP